MRKLRINLCTTSRFHLADLARELAPYFDVMLYSLVPHMKLKHHGVHARNCHWLGSRALYRLADCYLKRGADAETRRRCNERLIEAADFALSRVMRDCDLFIGMSGMCNRSARIAKSRGAKVWIERGSRHILSQQTILADLPQAEQVPESAVQRELQDYELADVISVLSSHAKASFLERGFDPSRVFVNPLGVNLESFSRPTSTISRAERNTVIFVGNWSYRKGADLLSSAVTRIGLNLVHVGNISDCEFPKSSRFVHIGARPQSELAGYYPRADLFCLPSREDGFGMVIPQALACGLPVVCSDRTGAPDLKSMVACPDAIKITEAGSLESLIEGLCEQINNVRSERFPSDILGDYGRNELSWEAYGRRYAHEVHRRFASLLHEMQV